MHTDCTVINTWNSFNSKSSSLITVLLTAFVVSLCDTRHIRRSTTEHYDAWYPVSVDEAAAADGAGALSPIVPYERFSCEGVGCVVIGPSAAPSCDSSSVSSFYNKNVQHYEQSCTHFTFTD